MASEAAPAAIDDLYEVPPAGFVQARNALVKSLKAAGQREQAEQAAKLSRPTASVWASNQVARREADLVARLADATARLQGGVTRDREKYAAAINHHRDLLNEVRARVESILAEAGLRSAPATVAAAVQNFRTGLMDANARALLLDGRLTDDVGLEVGAGLFGLASALGAGDAGGGGHRAHPPAKSHKPPSTGAADVKARERERREEERARHQRERAEAKARAEAEREVQARRKAADAASAAREKQEFAVASARRELTAAERALAELRAAEQEATAALVAAQSALKTLRR
ncbi:MAG TPA: hypothetical protein VHO67_04210 [Polyangia bacterium]|nr:hypothetical protein [Polyangia bacterium]